MFDVLVKNGRVVDGSGGPWRRVDIGIEGREIAAVGNLTEAEAGTVIDADDRVVCPGFIDIHSHSDFNLVINPRVQSKVRQGITTEVIGQCGVSAAPASRRRLESFKERWKDDFPEIEDLSWYGMDGYLELLEGRGIAVNCAAVVGHGNIRREVMGESDRPPTDREMAGMRQMLRESLEAGAFGMSSGLIYPPGVYADTEELVSLGEVLGEMDSIYFTHMRNEGDRLEEGLQEAIEVGKKGGCRVQVSHLKAIGEANWGKVERALEILEEARADGLEVTADQYPYTATSTGLSASVPAWAHDGGREALLERLADEGQREKMREEMEGRAQRWKNLVVSRVESAENRDCEGKSIYEIASGRGVDPREMVFDLLLEEETNVGVVNFTLDEDDVQTVMKSRLVMVGTDGTGLSPEGPLGKGKPHPRSYGTFPRILGRYVRELGILSLEEAVAKMTSRPAFKLGLGDRGLLLPGFKADVVIFDSMTVKDEATFTEPHAFPTGIDMVIVNGEIVVDGDRQRDVFPGEVLHGEYL